jgi:hypothetical protein
MPRGLLHLTISAFVWAGTTTGKEATGGAGPQAGKERDSRTRAGGTIAARGEVGGSGGAATEEETITLGPWAGTTIDTTKGMTGATTMTGGAGGLTITKRTGDGGAVTCAGALHHRGEGGMSGMGAGGVVTTASHGIPDILIQGDARHISHVPFPAEKLSLFSTLLPHPLVQW